MEQRRLGRTGQRSSVAILGGAAFWQSDPDTAAAALELALARGVNHLDIAPTYGSAETAVGPHVAGYADRLFISEKTGRHDPAGVRAQLETTLERFGIDAVDVYQVHGVTSLEDLETRVPAMETILAARDEGLCRWVGITGHDLGTAAAQLEACRRWDLDTVLFPVYPRVWADATYAADAAALLDWCTTHDVGVMAIKAAAWRPWPAGVARSPSPWYQPHQDPARLETGIRFALSTPGVTGFCTPGSLELLPTVLDIADRFEPLTDDERAAAVAEAAADPIIFPLAANA